MSCLAGVLAFERLRQLRQLEIGGERLALPMTRDADDVSDLLLQNDAQVLRGEEVAGAALGEQGGGSHGRMAGERQFALRRENPDPRGVDRVSRLKDEHGFRQIELGGDRLHPDVVEPVRVEHDRERVASERGLGEHVERLEPARHQENVLKPPVDVSSFARRRSLEYLRQHQ